MSRSYIWNNDDERDAIAEQGFERVIAESLPSESVITQDQRAAAAESKDAGRDAGRAINAADTNPQGNPAAHPLNLPALTVGPVEFTEKQMDGLISHMNCDLPPLGKIHQDALAAKEGEAVKREELIARLRDIAEEYKNRGVPSCALTIEAALTALQSREEVVRECAAVCMRIADKRFEEHGITEPDTNASYYKGRDADELDIRDEEDADCAAAILKHFNLEPK